MRTRLTLLQIFVFGALLGSFFDWFHTHGGVTAYPYPWIFGMAWWTPPLFGAAALSIAGSHVLLDRALGRRMRALPTWVVVGGVVYFGCFYYLSGSWHTSNFGKLAALLAGWAVLFGLLDRSWQGAVLALVTAWVGCTVEILLTGAGAFTHLTADRWGIPVWLPALYLLASLAVGNLGRKLLAGNAPPAR